MEMTGAVERAKRQLAEATGLKPLGVTGAYKDDQGWHVRVDMLVLSRIPAASDVLGDYEALVAEDGALLKFERRGNRLRGETRDG